MSTSGTVNGNNIATGEGTYIDWQLSSQNTPGNYSTIAWQAGWRYPANTCRGLRLGSAYVNGSLVWQNNSSGDGVHNFNSSHLSGGGHTKLQTASGVINVGHNGDGTKAFNLSCQITGWQNLVSVGSGWFTLPTIPRASPPPMIASIGEVSQTSFAVYWIDGAGGAPIDSRQLAYGTDPDTPETTISATNFEVITGLNPATRYYIWVRTHNSIGYSDWSARGTVLTIAGARVKVAGEWKQAIPYVRVSGTWVLARPWVNVLGEWKQTI